MKIRKEHISRAVSFATVKRSRDGRITPIRQRLIRMIWLKWVFLVILAGFIFVSSAVIITFGPFPITVAEVYHTIAERIIPGIASVNSIFSLIIWKIRLPIIFGTILAGFGLGICGCVMQAVLKNPMASPFTLGISAGAHFGVSLAAVFGINVLNGPYFLVGNAFICALLCSVLIIALSSLKGATSEMLVLAGIAVNYLFQAVNQLFSYMADDDQRSIMSLWGMGSLNDINWHSIYFLGAVSAACIPLLYLKAWDLNLMTVGDESARSMGVDANRTRMAVMCISSLLVSSIVSFIGIIGFIGLVAPHIGRILLGNDHRFLIPAAGGIGAALLLVANSLSLNVFPHRIIPAGLIMSIIGVPLFLYLILRGKRREFWS